VSQSILNMPGDVVDDAAGGAQLKVAEQDKHTDSVPTADNHVAHRDDSMEKHMVTVDGLEDFPTEEDLQTLRRVADHIPLKIFTIAFIELCERFSYYGTIIVVRECYSYSTLPLNSPS
jgi:proton-dependent oligopeptide transporter, POT family